jgi:hypothetical protein
VQGYEPTTQVGLPPNDRLLALLTNIRLGRSWMAVANTLAYYDTETITTTKSFIVQSLGAQWPLL